MQKLPKTAKNCLLSGRKVRDLEREKEEEEEKRI
jgi:hypothetical protein